MSHAPESGSSRPRYFAVVPAAGIGRRMGAALPKQYLRLRGRTVLEHTLSRLHGVPEIEALVLALHPEDRYWPTIDTANLARLRTVTGGAERIHSVRLALAALEERADPRDWVLVHDAVRPCVTISDIRHLIQSLRDDPVGGLLAAPVGDTVKRTNADGVVEATLDRSRLWLAATPQMFRFGLLLEALDRALARGHVVTDEAAAVEALGQAVRVVAGRADNVKLTRPEDLRLAEFLLGAGEE